VDLPQALMMLLRMTMMPILMKMMHLSLL